MAVLNPVAIGVDVGQIQDPTAVAVTEVAEIETGKIRPVEYVPAHFGPDGQWVNAKYAEPVMATDYTVRFIRRLPLGTSYPDVALYIAELLCSPLLANRSVRVLIDVTGVGRPVYDDLKGEVGLRKEALRKARCEVSLQPISFVHGERYNRKLGTLGKAYLVSRLQSLLQGRRVHAPDTAEVKATLDELRVYEIKVSNEGKDTYGASIGKHDDLATALGLSCLEDPYANRVRYSKRIY
jgi:hypothetical protein